MAKKFQDRKAFPNAPYGFHWRSELTEQQKIDINQWIINLSEGDRKILDILLDDCREQAEFDTREEYEVD